MLTMGLLGFLALRTTSDRDRRRLMDHSTVLSSERSRHPQTGGAEIPNSRKRRVRALRQRQLEGTDRNIENGTERTASDLVTTDERFRVQIYCCAITREQNDQFWELRTTMAGQYAKAFL